MKTFKIISKTLVIVLMLGLCFSLTGCFDSDIEKLFKELESDKPNLTMSIDTEMAGMTFTSVIEMDGNKVRMQAAIMEFYYEIVDGGMNMYTKVLGSWTKVFQEIDEDAISDELGTDYFPEGINASSFVLKDGVYVLTDEAKESLDDFGLEDIRITYDSKEKTYELEISSLLEGTTKVIISKVGKTSVTLPEVK